MNKKNYLHVMGIDVWKERVFVIPSKQGESGDPQFLKMGNDEAQWKNLENRMKACQAYGLHQTRTKMVFGVGNCQADLLLIGEALGQQEDLKSDLFVGRAGQLLNNILVAINLKREDVYISNILKCCPPNNGDLQPEEVVACTSFLLEQIALIQPKLIVALGKIVSNFLLKTTTTLTELRGKEFRYGELQTPLLVTFHPAYLLHAPVEKRKAWEDWQLIRFKLDSINKNKMQFSE